MKELDRLAPKLKVWERVKALSCTKWTSFRSCLPVAAEWPTSTSHYSPNARLSIAAHYNTRTHTHPLFLSVTAHLASKSFSGAIPDGPVENLNAPKEPTKSEPRKTLSSLYPPHTYIHI